MENFSKWNFKSNEGDLGQSLTRIETNSQCLDKVVIQLIA